MSGLGDFAKVIAEVKKAKKEAEEKSVSHQALKSLEESVKVNNPFRASVKIETRIELAPPSSRRGILSKDSQKT